MKSLSALQKKFSDQKLARQFYREAKQLEGEWKFQGYYPPGCKRRPECHTLKMGLSMDDSLKRAGGWFSFKTKAQMQGKGCNEEEREFRYYGSV